MLAGYVTGNGTYSIGLVNDGGLGRFFSRIAGPAWLNVASSGALSGTPASEDVGLNNWMVQVSDGVDTNIATLEITVDAVSSAPTTLFSDGFESGELTTGGWMLTGSCKATTKSSDTGIYGLRVRKIATCEKAISTVGYRNITVSYSREVRDAATLKGEWSTNGSSWTELENLSATACATQAFALPASADNQSGFRIRFGNTGTAKADASYIDYVSIVGE
jgi:hypothetical protein